MNPHGHPPHPHAHPHHPHHPPPHGYQHAPPQGHYGQPYGAPYHPQNMPYGGNYAMPNQGAYPPHMYPPRGPPPQGQYPQHYPQYPQHSPQPQYSVPPTWIPNPADSSQLETWFRSLDIKNSNVIEGAQAVGFLKRSNLSRDILRKIWGMVDTQNIGSIDRRQFAITMRLVSLACSQPHLPLSMERYHQTAHESIPLPSMNPLPSEVSPSSMSTPPPVLQSPGYYNHQGGSFSTPPQLSTPPLPPTQTPPPQFYSHTASAPIISSSSPSLQPSSIHISNDSTISGLEMRNETDEFDMGDFQSAANANNKNEDDDIGDFQSASISSPPSVEVPPASINQQFHSQDSFDSSKKHSKIDDMIAMVAVDPLNTHAPTLRNIQESQPEPDLLILSDPILEHSPKKDHRPNLAMSALDEIVEQDLQAATEDWDDFVDSVSVNSKVEPAVNPFDVFVQAAPDIMLHEVQTIEPPINVIQSPEEEDDYGDFESGATNPPEKIDHAPVVMHSDDHDEFGDFEGNDWVTVSEASSVGIQEVHRVETTVSVVEKPEAVQDDFFDADFGEFVVADPQQESARDMESSIGLPPANNANSIGGKDSEAPLGKTDNKFPEQVPDDEEFDDFESAPPATPHFVTQEADPFSDLGTTSDSLLEGFELQSSTADHSVSTSKSHLDILSEYTSPSVSTPKISTDDFLGFESFTPSVSSQNTLSFLDEFIPSLPTNFSTSTTSQSTSSSFLDNSLLDLSTSTPPAKQLPKPIDRNLTSDELEYLSTVLYDLNLYYEAYCSIRQSITVKRIKELNSQKMNAVENDNLELAIKLRDEINGQKDQLLGTREDELIWLELASAGKRRESLEDIIEFLESIDPICGEVAKTKFLVLSPDETSNNLLEKYLFKMNSRRCLQLAIAIRTTHKSHVTHWKNMMAVITKKLTDSIVHLEEFKKLKFPDQNTLVSLDQVKIFVEGIYRITLVGKWISASCQDAMIETAIATKTLSLCDTIFQIINSSLLKNILQSVSPNSITELGNVATDLIGRKDVVYCSLTLRPIRLEASKDRFQSATRRIDHHEFPYMQAAFCLWLHSFPGVAPPKNPIMFT